MKSHVRVAVIGGGVVGCSVLYHLTRLGWSDVMLIERAELTHGSTWHAAGGFHTLNADTNMAALQGYTIRLYRELEELTGQSCGLHHVGGLTLASDPDRLDFLKAERAKHRYMGLETEIVGPAEVARLSPITNPEGLLGALYDPLDGHLDPAGTTQAYARGARMQGAEIVLRNPVRELHPRPDGSWDVVTEKGTVNAEYVVNAAGLWAREVGEMAGVYLPCHPMEHQYLVTDDLPEVYERDAELPHCMDPAGESYLRQEGRGLVIGMYEQRCELWAVDGTPEDFGPELLPEKIDRIADKLDVAYERYPVLRTAGVKRIISGPFTFAPDGNPLVGPVPGLRNYWAACAVMAGFSQGGGVGLALAEWMIEGEPSRDIFAMDVARFGDWCTRPYTRAKVRENYQRRFAVSYPNEELPAARGLVTTPAYGVWAARNAVFGAGYGLEHVNWFAPEGEPAFEQPSFRRSNAFRPVAAECRAVREAVGINEIHNFGKYLVEGPEAEAWLSHLMANRMPEVGRIVLTPMLSPKGRLVGDFTVARLAPERFQLTASYAAQAFHMRWFEAHLPAGGGGAGRRLGAQRLARAHRVPDRGSPGAGGARRGGAIGRRLEPGPALLRRARDGGGTRPRARLPLELHGRPRLRDLRGPGAPGRPLPGPRRGRGGARDEALRDAGDDVAPAREVVRGVDAGVPAGVHPRGDRPRPVRRSGQEPLHRPRRRDARARCAPRAAPLHVRGRCARRGRVGGRADLRGRRGRRIRDLGRLRALERKSIALGFVPVELMEDGGAEFTVEILGERRAATLLREPILDPRGERMRG